MATLKMNNATKIGSVPSQKANPGEVNSPLHVTYDEITLTGELANNDLLQVGAPLPKGARIVDAKLVVPDMGGTGTMDLGTAADSDALIAALDTSGQAALGAPAAGAADLGKKLEAETQYYIKANGASVSGTGKTIKAWIIWSLV